MTTLAEKLLELYHLNRKILEIMEFDKKSVESICVEGSQVTESKMEEFHDLSIRLNQWFQ